LGWPTPDWDSVRRLFDLNLTAEHLPDIVLMDDVFLGRAQEDALTVDPDAATYTEGGATDTQFERVRRALAYFVASRVAGSWREKQSESWQSGRYSYTLPKFDAEARQAQLAAEGAAILAGNLPVVETPRRMPTAFSRATGGRWP
jgi:hypothetical protein